MKKSCGILMPVFSLPGEYGIGTFGKESYSFADFLKRSGHGVWQTLPLGPTTFGDSPYQALSDVALNPYFIDLEDLFARGLVTRDELDAERTKVSTVDYARLYKRRYALYKKAYSRFLPSDEFLSFVNSKKVYRYALFCVLKDEFGSLNNFPTDIKNRKKRAIDEFLSKHSDEYLFYTFIQYILFEEFAKLKAYLKELGIKLMGDLPLYVAADGEEVWSSPDCFEVDENLAPKRVAGVPPDYFSRDGQLWGNPVYNYSAMKKDGYKWWKNRLRLTLNRFDLVRIDHFRGLDRFWAIPQGEKAINGNWVKADGEEILSSFTKNNLVAEDLGTIDDGVRKLLASTGIPGMKVLLFAFDKNPNNPYLPENVTENSVTYVGTHDNDTAYGYIKSLDGENYSYLRGEIAKRLRVAPSSISGKRALASALVETAYSVKSNLVVISFADACRLDNRYRINRPSTLGNWKVRYNSDLFSDELAEELNLLASRHSRKA